MQLFTRLNIPSCEHLIASVIEIRVVAMVEIIVSVCTEAECFMQWQKFCMHVNSFDNMIRQSRKFRNWDDPVNCGMKHPNLRSLGHESGRKDTKAMDRTRGYVVFNQQQ